MVRESCPWLKFLLIGGIFMPSKGWIIFCQKWKDLIKLSYAKPEAAPWHSPENKLLKEWMKRHYPKVGYKIVKSHEKELAAARTGAKPGILIVSGAYHRNKISMWFHRNLADLLMNEIKALIFIAHNWKNIEYVAILSWVESIVRVMLINLFALCL